MEKSNNRLEFLLQNYLNGVITAEDNQELWVYLSDERRRQELESILPDAYDQNTPIPGGGLADSKRQQILDMIFSQQMVKTKPAGLKLWSRIAVAAAVASIIVGAGLFYAAQQKVQREDLATAIAGKNIHAGSTGATLTLANGKKILLAPRKIGKLAEQANVSITKKADGSIAYTVLSDTRAERKAMNNTLTTARGETYKLVLPDQSEVWLNAASSITYPSNFVSSKNAPRKVEITGEAYFEITKDHAHPFIVKTANQQVQVLGTHFNVNAYSDEKYVTTTLIEGAVMVNAAGPAGLVPDRNQVLLKPNQQSVFTGKSFTVKEIDASDAIAWKNGYFMFNSEELGSIMNRVGRWYNVEVVFEDESLKSKTFFGSISRFEQISKVLDVLKRTGAATFTISGHIVTVKNK